MHGSAVTIPPANSLGLGSKMCSKRFTLNNRYRFLIIFFLQILRKKNQFKGKKMNKIESIQTGEKNIGKFYCADQGLNQGLPGWYSSVLTTTLTML